MLELFVLCHFLFVKLTDVTLWHCLVNSWFLQFREDRFKWKQNLHSDGLVLFNSRLAVVCMEATVCSLAFLLVLPPDNDTCDGNISVGCCVSSVSISSPIDSREEYCMLEVVGVSTLQPFSTGGLSVASVSSVMQTCFATGLKPRMSDANKDFSLIWIFLLLTMSVNSNLVQLINISQDNSRFKQINFSESSDFQQLRSLSTRW